MANRYQSFSFTTASVASGVVLQASQILGPHCYNLVKLKIVRNTGNGNINFRIFKKGVWGSANRLIRFENQAVPLLHPVDKTSGSPGIEALEGLPLPIDDEDGTNNDGAGKLHHELENLGTTSTFTISGEYEEVVVLSSAGDPSWRGAVSALTSLSLRGATSGVVTIQVGAAAAGTWTLKLPTTGGTADYALTSDGTGISNWVSGQSIAGLKTTDTPQFARLGLGAAADANAQVYVAVEGVAGMIRLRAAGTGGAAGIPNYELYRSKGTIASPTNLSDTDPIGTLRTLVYCGATGFWNAAQINFVVDGAVVDNQRPGARMDFYTNVPNGAQTLRVSFRGDGSVVLNASGSALATNATTGFTYIPSCAGTPTGTPTSNTGAVALVYDTTNNKLYAYNAAWKSVTLA